MGGKSNLSPFAVARTMLGILATDIGSRAKDGWEIEFVSTDGRAHHARHLSNCPWLEAKMPDASTTVRGSRLNLAQGQRAIAMASRSASSIGSNLLGCLLTHVQSVLWHGQRGFPGHLGRAIALPRAESHHESSLPR